MSFSIVWLIKGYMDGLPKELDEAAQVDGAIEWQVFTKVSLPLSHLRTFAKGNFATNWGQFSAAVVLSCVPLAIVWGFAQKYVEAGLAQGAIKG